MRHARWTRWLALAGLVVTLIPATPGLSAPIEGYRIAEEFSGWYGAIQEAPDGTLVFQVSPGDFVLREPDGTQIPITGVVGDPRVNGVNSLGQVVGYTDIDDPDEDSIERRTWVWATDGSITYLPFLEGGDYLRGEAISESGWVAGIAFDGGGDIRTFVWDPVGGTRSMADSGDPNWTFGVNGMFADNRVYGVGLDNGVRSVYVWSEPSGIQFIGNLGGSFIRVETGDISGVIAGFATNGDGNYQAWLWSDTTPLTAISPADSLPNFVPWSVTSNLVVGGPTKVSGEDRGAIWTSTGGYQIRDVPGSVLSRVTDVRSDGSALGYVFDSSNGTRGGVWHPDGSFEFLPDAYRAGRFLPNGQILGDRNSTRYPAIWVPLVDADGDGVEDSIDPDGGDGTAPAGAFDDPHADGQLLASIGGGDFTVTDEPDPAGVRMVVTGPVGSAVQVDVCGFTMTLFAGTEAVFTCGSVIVELVTGSLVLESGDGLFTAAIEGPAAAEIDLANGEWSVSVQSGSVTVSVDGIQRTIGADEDATFRAWDFEGFFDPVMNDGIVNTVRAGRVVPLAWSVANADGPVTDLTQATVTWVPGSCGDSEEVNPVDQSAAGSSGLQNLGDGVYQFNWKTSKSDAGTCGVLQLDIDDGILHEATFQLN